MRTKAPRFLFILALLVPMVAWQGPLVAQSAADAGGDQDVPVFATESAAVQLDVVVRDKRGHLITDLTAGDFEVYEDGERQAITGFVVFDAGPLPEEPAPAAAREAAPATALPPPAPTQGASPGVIAFVFDSLTAEGRDRAYKATQDYLEKGHVEGDVVAVFALDQSLHAIQPFTRNIDEIRQGFEIAARRGTVQFADVGREALEKSRQLERLLASGASDIQSQITADQMAMETRMLQQYDRLERDRSGYASANALLALVQGLKALPGRKAAVFFSEGVNITANVLSEFRSVIATANRANVSVYAIDVGGLRTESGTKEARDNLMATMEMRSRQERSGSSGNYAGSLMKDVLEHSEDMLRDNPNAGLGQLAEETGGFLVADTNDASKGFARIQEEMRFYYLLSYAPTNAAFDGSYRKIEVKVNRKGMRIQSRNGYLAVPPDITVPVRTYEAPVLAQLDAKPRPSAFPMRTSALVFPEAERPGRVPVMVEFQVGAMDFSFMEERKLHAVDFAVVARVRDEKGREIDRLSRDYKVGYPPEQLEQAKAANVLFFEETDLQPGTYTIDAAAYDAVGQKASVTSATLEVPDPKDKGPRLSSIVLVKRADRLTAEEAEKDNPLYFGQTMLYPAVGEPFKKSVMPEIGFYFTAYPGQGEPPPTRAVIEVLKDGKPALKTAATLSGADAQGRLKHAGTLPLASLEPGTYSLRVTVAAGPNFVRRQSDFVVEP